VSTIEIFGKKKSFDTFWSFPYMISLFLCIIDLFQMWIGVFLTPQKKLSYYYQKLRNFFKEFFLSVDLNNFVNF
jgi:hypothetical protein